MSMVLAALQSGWLTLGALAFMWVEFALICALSAAPAARCRLLLPNFMAGTGLIAAVHFAVQDQALYPVLICMALALVAHIWDLVGRLRAQAG
jgi:hypothetical protein